MSLAADCQAVLEQICLITHLGCTLQKFKPWNICTHWDRASNKKIQPKSQLQFIKEDYECKEICIWYISKSQWSGLKQESLLQTPRKLGGKEQLKILQGHNLYPRAKQNFIIPEQNSVDTVPAAVWKEVSGNTRKWESVYPKKIKKIIWSKGKRRGHKVLSPSASWHLWFAEHQATAVQNVAEKQPWITES